MRFLTAPLLLLAIACVPPEEGIDRTTLEGQVEIPPVAVEESADPLNDTRGGANDIGELGLRVVTLTGNVRGFGVNPDTGVLTEDADEDWFRFTGGKSFSATLQLTLEDAASEVRFEVYNLDLLDEADAPTRVTGSDVVGGGTLTFDFEGGTTYAVYLAGLNSTVNRTPFEVVFIGPDPADAGILAGAYLSDDPAERGYPVAGSPTNQWRLEGTTWRGAYAMLYVREVVNPEDEGGQVTVNEDLSTVWVYAGTWANLNQGLPAGTLYSSEPVEVSLPDDPENDGETVLADPVVLNEIAPLVVGFSVAEVEPNDGEFDDAYNLMFDVTEPQGIGTLTGPGFVDIITGTHPLTAEVAWLAHDTDVFSFSVSEPIFASFTLGWDNSADIDLLVFDDAGLFLDGLYTTSNPEVSAAPTAMDPDLTYYLMVIGYSGPEGSEPAYELRIEQTAQ